MIHIRIDDDAENCKRRFACGLGPELPKGDQYFFQSEVFWHHRVDCLGCNPGALRQLGTGTSELSGRPADTLFSVRRSPGLDGKAILQIDWSLEMLEALDALGDEGQYADRLVDLAEELLVANEASRAAWQP